MKKREDFKYTAKFPLQTKANFVPYEKFVDKNRVAKANLENLRGLMPDEDVIKDNSDLFYNSFDAAVANLVNLNDDGIMTEEAIAMAPKFVNRHMNIEHDRWNVIGHIINSAFSTFGDSEIIEVKDLEGTDKLFNISLAAVAYKVIDPYFVDFMERRSEEVSASWEIGFDEFIIALGSKNLSKAEIIDDDNQVKELMQYLKAYGGTGFTKEGEEVYRIIKGEPQPLGCAYTLSPAAAVKGILKAGEDKDKEDVYASLANYFNGVDFGLPKTKEKPEGKQKNKKNNSQEANANVKPNKSMKIVKIEDIQQDKWEEIEASSVRDFVYSELESANDKFLAEKAEKEKALAAAKAEQDKAKADLEQNSQELEKVKSELAELKEQAEAAASQRLFDDRMSLIAEQYDLDDKHTKIVAKNIQGLSNEEFETWKEEFEVFASSLKKKAKGEESTEDLESEVAKASVPKATIPNSASAPKEKDKETLKDSFQLGKGVTIK